MVDVKKHPSCSSSSWRSIIFWWSVLSVVVLLFQSIARLLPRALEPILAQQLSLTQIWIYVGWVIFNFYTEGYRGFQKKFSPRVVQRAAALSQNPRMLQVVLAPMYCMGLIYASRRRLIASWILVAAIVSLVILVRFLEQPWRGIIDGGVVVGLGYGALSILGLAICHVVKPSTAELI